MSYLNLKSRPSVEIGGNYSPPPPTAATRNSSVMGAFYTPLSSGRTFSPPREPIALAMGNSAAASSAPAPSSAFSTTLQQVPLPTPSSMIATSLSDPSAYAPASTVLKVELEHTRSVLDRQTELTHRLEKEKRQLLDQIELMKREAREVKEVGAAEWRKRLNDASDENERLRSDKAILHEEVAKVKADLTESQRNERRAEGVYNKLKDAEEALHRQEIATNEVRKAKQGVERDLEELRRNNPAVVLNSKIQQLQVDLEAKENELRNKQTEIVALNKQLQETSAHTLALDERLRAEERHSAQLVIETQELSKRLLENEKKYLDRENDLKKAIGDLEMQLKLLQQRSDEAFHARDMAEQTLSNVQRENKRQMQGTDLHLAQRAAEIDSLNKQLEVYKTKLTEITRELTEVETRASNDRKIRDGLEAEISRSTIVQQDLKMSNDRLQREFLRSEKDNDTLFTQINALNDKYSVLLDEKQSLEKTLESANVKLEIAARVATDLDHCERQLSEKRVLVAELESKIRSLEPFAARTDALTTMNDSLRAEMNAARNELTVLRMALDEEREQHTRTNSRAKLLEAKLAQSDDRHEEMHKKLKTLELMNGGDRANQLAGTFVALHEKINAADSDNTKILEMNAALMREVKALEEANKELERQVMRARELTREAEMEKVQAEIARDEVSEQLHLRERDLTAMNNQYEQVAPLQIAAERKSYSETMATLQQSLAAEKEHNRALQQQLAAAEGLKSVIESERALNRQLKEEISLVNNSRLNLASPLREGVLGAQKRRDEILASATLAGASSPIPTPTDGHQESIVKSVSSPSAIPAAADISSKNLSPTRVPSGALDASMNTNYAPSSSNIAVGRQLSPPRAATASPIARPTSPARAPTVAPSSQPTSGSTAIDAVAGMAKELVELRKMSEDEKYDRDSRIDMLSNSLAEAIKEMRGLRNSRDAAQGGGGDSPARGNSSTMGRLGSGKVAAPHRALTGGSGSGSGGSPFRQTERYYAEVVNNEMPDSPQTSPYRRVGGGGVVMVSTPQRVVTKKAAPRTTNVTINTTHHQPAAINNGASTSRLTATTASSRAKYSVNNGNSFASVTPQRQAAAAANASNSGTPSTNTPRGLNQSRAVRKAADFDIANDYADGSDEQQQQKSARRTATIDTEVIDPSTLDDDELMLQLEAAKRRMKKALLSDRMAASPSPGKNFNSERARF